MILLIDWGSQVTILSHIALMEIGVDAYYRLLPDVEIALNDEGCLKVHDNLLKTDWLQTNDVVELNDTGFLVLGRIDFVINTGGVKVFPEKLETKLVDFIPTDFFVIGTPDEVLGERITVVVEGKENDSIRRELLNLNWGIEKPREVIFREQLERTESGKIKRTR